MALLGDADQVSPIDVHVDCCVAAPDWLGWLCMASLGDADQASPIDDHCDCCVAGIKCLTGLIFFSNFNCLPAEFPFL